jgi:hypothetical protein
MTVTSWRIQNPLTLVMPLKPGHAANVEGLIGAMPATADNPILKALEGTRLVHFARFVLLKGDRLGVDRDYLGVFTTFDGDFDDYMLAFIQRVGQVFDVILEHVEGAEPLIPVRDNPNLFVDYVRANDMGVLGEFYSAYPDMGVLDVRRATRAIR